MRLVAYIFEGADAADHARNELVDAFDMAPTDAVVAPVADAEVVVAVRARDENVDDVKHVLEEHGGTHATEIPEEWSLGD